MLGIKYPPAGSAGPKFYLCSRHIPGTKLSHYYVEKVENMLLQIIQIPPYTLVNSSTDKNTNVFPYVGNGTGHILTRRKILKLPRIPITTEEKLLERIKLLVLFS
jgi:hypothetical protein